MGCAERPDAFAHVAAAKDAGDRVNRDHFERFVFGQSWQDGRHSACEHRFACTGRSHKQHIVSAGRSDFERPFCSMLTNDIGKVSCVTIGSRDAGDFTGAGQCAVAQLAYEIAQRRRS